MKTTIEITDSLFEEAKRCAAKGNVSMRSLVEEGLRTVIQARESCGEPFKLRDGSVGGEGPTLDLSWEQVRGIIYEGHGG